MNILKAIKVHLVAAGITRTIKYNAFADAPIDQLIIRDTGEIEPDPDNTASTEIEQRTFQIIVRGSDYDATVAICGQIRDALHNKINLTINDGTTAFQFKNIAMFTGFQPITNEIGNYEFSGNFKARVMVVAQ